VLVAFLWLCDVGHAQHLLQAKQSPLSPARVGAAVATLQSADIGSADNRWRRIRLRRVTSPTAEQRTLFQQLGVPLPENLTFDHECSADFAIA
jgi:hypothetical protein